MSHAASFSTTDQLVNRTVSLLDRIFPPPRAFAIRLWNGTELQGSERRAADARRFVCVMIYATI